ncbi:MAG TPA: hypothetical protein VKR06_20615 [Ktedonosporobacter sp.]|nr:hypothetical protein [Ktedonosporobacter sp.]
MQENPHPYPSQSSWPPQQTPQQSSQSFSQYPPASSRESAPAQSYQHPLKTTSPSQSRRAVSRKTRRWPWMLAIFAALIIGYAAGASYRPAGGTTNVQKIPPSLVVAPGPLLGQTPPIAQSTQAPAQVQPTQTPSGWQTTHTFSGNGIKKTVTFIVANTWKISWKCTPTSVSTGYNVIVNVFRPDDSLPDLAVNAICKNGNTEGTTQMHQGGALYLYINSEGSWAVAIQELK